MKKFAANKNTFTVYEQMSNGTIVLKYKQGCKLINLYAIVGEKTRKIDAQITVSNKSTVYYKQTLSVINTDPYYGELDIGVVFFPFSVVKLTNNASELLLKNYEVKITFDCSDTTIGVSYEKLSCSEMNHYNEIRADKNGISFCGNYKYNFCYSLIDQITKAVGITLENYGIIELK